MRHVEGLGCISNCQTFFRLGISFKRTKAQHEKQFKGELLQTERFLCGRVGKGKPKGAFAPVGVLGSSMAPQSMFESIDPDDHSGASMTEVPIFYCLYTKPNIREKGPKGSKTKREVFGTQKCPPLRVLL